MSAAELTLSPQLFALYSSMIESFAGLHHAPNSRDILAGKLAERAQELGFETLLDYYYYLRYDEGGAAELVQLADGLVVNETYFFRESSPLEVLVDQIVLPQVRAGGRPRIWSAACASGEEPLTLAIMLAERGHLGDVEIVASDLSQTVLDRAAVGHYRQRAFRSLPAGVRERWFSPRGDEWKVDPELTAAISWRRVNLIDPLAVAALGRFPVICCRNVLIYFSDDTVAAVLGTLANALLPDGHLLVGVSESLMRFGTALGCEERSGCFFYRRRDRLEDHS